jgi:uncharacterized protein (DUF2062 family)
MPKKFINRYMPDHNKIRTHKSLRIFGTLLHDPNLWHLNRRSVSAGIAIGLFVAFLPLPLHMLIAAALAIPLRANLPLAVAAVWINNPFTMVPLYYLGYHLGAVLMGSSAVPHTADLNPGIDWLFTEGWDILEPMLLGGLIVGLICALLGYVGVRLLWRWHVVHRLRARQRGVRHRNGG